MLSHKALTALESCFLFKAISAEQIQSLMSECQYEIREFEAESYIRLEKYPFGILLCGKAQILKHRGNAKVIFRQMKPSEAFGASYLFDTSDGYESLTDILAKTKCRVLFFTAESIKNLILSNALISENYIEFLTGRIRFLNQKIDSFTAGSAERKVIKFLLSLKADSEGSLILPISLQKVAETLDMGRASLYRILDSLSQKQLIEKNSKTIKITNREALEKLS